MTTERIDVLDVMQRASLRLAELSQGCKTATEAALQEARSAMAELIEADREYDAARLEYQRARRGMLPHEGADEKIRFLAADARRAAALARVGGAS